jgi:hypothetical protein
VSSSPLFQLVCTTANATKCGEEHPAGYFPLFSLLAISLILSVWQSTSSRFRGPQLVIKFVPNGGDLGYNSGEHSTGPISQTTPTGPRKRPQTYFYALLSGHFVIKYSGRPRGCKSPAACELLPLFCTQVLVSLNSVLSLGIQNCPRFSHFRYWASASSNSDHYFHYCRRHFLHPTLRSCS